MEKIWKLPSKNWLLRSNRVNDDARDTESVKRSAQVSPLHMSAFTAEHELFGFKTNRRSKESSSKSGDWARAAAAWVCWKAAWCPSWLDRQQKQRRYRSNTWTPPVHAQPRCAIFWHMLLKAPPRFWPGWLWFVNCFLLACFLSWYLYFRLNSIIANYIPF